MTGYHISLGYNSSGGADWDDVKAIANSITKDELRAEYSEYETITRCGSSELTIDDFIDTQLKQEDASMKFLEDEEGEEQIMLLASGGGCNCRLMKEGLRRAFCRLMLKKAHGKHIEISIHVA